MRRPAGASPRRKRTRDHFRVRLATQTDARGHFGCPKCVAPLEMPSASFARRSASRWTRSTSSFFLAHSFSCCSSAARSSSVSSSMVKTLFLLYPPRSPRDLSPSRAPVHGMNPSFWGFCRAETRNQEIDQGWMNLKFKKGNPTEYLHIFQLVHTFLVFVCGRVMRSLYCSSFFLFLACILQS
jgi:hypothetical protein